MFPLSPNRNPYYSGNVCKHTFVADAIKILQIKGGGLKSHTKTHWSTIHRIQAKGPIYRSKVACCTGSSIRTPNNIYKVRYNYA
ncbi:unnamed protein product [Rhizophagus irregularis]|nr:unnamed protein product [Rhizophagus irregularis]